MERNRVVFVLGPPGVGKTTQCRRLAQNYDFVHICPGELLRHEKSNTQAQHQELIKSCIKEGKIAPASITCKLIEQEMKKSKGNKFLLDGFPRNLENRFGYEKYFGNKNDLMFVVLIEAPTDVCAMRCLSRGAVVDSDRVDDDQKIVEKRIQIYKEETESIISFYDRMNLVKFVDGTKSEDLVYEQLKEIFDSVTK